MKTVVLCVSLLVLLAGCSHAREQTFLLPASQGPKLTKQCSRQSIVADAYWDLTTRQADDFERALRRFLEQPASREIAAVLGPLGQYHRQLIGFMRNGRRYIYANFYVVPANEVQWRILFGMEATKFVSACDGGPQFWGATFDVQSGKITTIDTNGTIGGGACHWDFATHHPAEYPSCGCVAAGPMLKRPLPPLPTGLRYCPSM